MRNALQSATPGASHWIDLSSELIRAIDKICFLEIKTVLNIYKCNPKKVLIHKLMHVFYIYRVMVYKIRVVKGGG